MLKISNILAAVVLIMALTGGGMAWAATTHASGKAPAPRRQHVTVVTVQADDPNWTDTGVDLQAHQALTITAQGTVKFAQAPGDTAKPPGQSKVSYGCDVSTRPGGNVLVAPSLNCNSLIGMIGNNSPFQASYVNVSNSTSGELYLMMNDAIGDFGDNSGHWTVTITTSP